MVHKISDSPAERYHVITGMNDDWRRGVRGLKKVSVARFAAKKKK